MAKTTKKAAKPLATPGSKWTKEKLLSRPVEHIDIKSFDARPIVDAYRETAFQARNLANASDIYDKMLADKDCAVILTLAGSMISAGLKEAIITLIENNMVDAIVSTGANIVPRNSTRPSGY